MKRSALFRIILWSIVIAILTTAMIGIGFGISFNRRRSSTEAVLAVTTPPEASIAPKISNARITASGLNVRKMPDSMSEVVGNLHKNDKIIVTRTESVSGIRWAYTTEPITGWVMAEYIELYDMPVEETMTSANSNGYGCPAEDIRELDIEWLSGKIKIYPGNTDRITVEENGDISDKYAMVIQRDRDSLKIRFFQEDRHVIGLHSIPDKDLTITVPVDWYCESLEIETASASLEVRDLDIGEVEFSGASGTCDFDNCTVDLLDIGTASGDVRFTGSLNRLDCDAASANVYAELTNVPYSMDLETMSGDLELILPQNAGYTLQMDTMSGNFTTEFLTKGLNGMQVSGDGACRINISALSGDVTIRKGA